MSRLLVTSRYLKGGSKNAKNKRSNYTKYIATRETVETRDTNDPSSNCEATQKQKNLINDLLKEFPDSKLSLEYEDYKAKPTTINASEFINSVMEKYADAISNRENFVGYMAMRPGAERRGQHGLFNEKDEPINLNQVAKEVSEHPGNVWSHVISLRREDAARLGYNNSEAWRQLVLRHINDIAEASKIPIGKLKWYAAFHNTTHHPHIHLILYSIDSNVGFLTNEGIEKIRSKLTNDIFEGELKNVYAKQTLSRDEIKALAEDQMQEISDEFQLNELQDTVLHELILKLKKQLDETDGKKVYGYLKKPVKQTVDEVFHRLSENEHIKELYDKWCEFERAKYRYYTSKNVEIPNLVDNKVFKPVKNMIIRTVLNMELPDNNEYVRKTYEQEEVPQSEQSDEFEKSESESPGLYTDRSSSGEEQNFDEEHRLKEQEALTATVMSLFMNLCSVIRNDYAQEQRKMRPKADKKLLRMIRKKEISLGHKYDDMDMKM